MKSKYISNEFLNEFFGKKEISIEDLTRISDKDMDKIQKEVNRCTKRELDNYLALRSDADQEEIDHITRRYYYKCMRDKYLINRVISLKKNMSKCRNHRDPKLCSQSIEKTINNLNDRIKEIDNYFK